MELHDLRPDPGSTSARKRVGRGYASGLGKTSGFGQKGQKARTGHHKVPVWFEGAPSKVNTIKRTGYKRGVSFNNPFRVTYETVSLDQLADWEGGDITPESLAAAGLVKRKLDVKPYKVQGEDVLRYKPVKVLGDGEVTKPLTVRVHRLTASAKQKITAAGGTFQELTPAKTKAEEE